MQVDVIAEDPRWEEVGLSDLSVRAVEATLSHLGLSDDWDVVVMGCDDARIAGLNADFRGKPQPTNVLSWPSEERGADIAGTAPDLPVFDGDPELGDIAIAFETTKAEAEAGGISLADHTTHLIVHATLHLLGYDHIREADGDLMEGIETAILGKLGIADPYVRGTPDELDD